MYAQTAIPNFPHRQNRDGSYDSICRGCFVTVATADTEVELLPFEIKHVCQGSLPVITVTTRSINAD